MARRGRRWSRLALALTLLGAPAIGISATGAAGSVAVAEKPEEGSRDDGSFRVTPPVVCKEISGFGDYVPLPDAALTRDDKLLVYFTPVHYKTARVGKKYEAHFTQDGRIHRRGQKAVIWSRNKVLELRESYDAPPTALFIRNAISLKDLKPGEYDFEIIVHDMIGKGPPATQTVPFRVVPTVESDVPKKAEPGRRGGRSGSR